MASSWPGSASSQVLMGIFEVRGRGAASRVKGSGRVGVDFTPSLRAM